MVELEEAVLAIVRRELKPLQEELEALREGAPGADLITLKVAGKLVGREPKTLDGWVRRGRLQGYGEKGERQLVSRKELLQVAAQPRRRDVGPADADTEFERFLRKAQ